MINSLESALLWVDSHAEGFQFGDLGVAFGGVDRVAFCIETPVGSEAFFAGGVLFGHLDQRAEVVNLVVLQEGKSQFGQSCKWRQISDFVGTQVQVGEPFQKSFL